MTERIRLVGEAEQPETSEAFRSSHDKRWDALGPEDALWVRQALVRAQELRTSDADPGDAYLEGRLATLAGEQATAEPTSAA